MRKKFMIWATVSSRSCFCWLYRAFPSLAAKNIINLISQLLTQPSKLITAWLLFASWCHLVLPSSLRCIPWCPQGSTWSSLWGGVAPALLWALQDPFPILRDGFVFQLSADRSSPWSGPLWEPKLKNPSIHIKGSLNPFVIFLCLFYAFFF